MNKSLNSSAYPLKTVICSQVEAAKKKMFGEIGYDREFNDFTSSHTLPNNLLSDHPNLLAPLQSLIRKQRSAASGLNIVTTKNPISFKDSNTKNLFQKFGPLSQRSSCNHFQTKLIDQDNYFLIRHAKLKKMVVIKRI